MIEETNTWNHRVIRVTDIDPITKQPEHYYQIHEVHYTNGVPHSVTINPITVGGENIDEIKWTLEKMLMATGKEVIPMEYFDNLAKDAEQREDELDAIADKEEIDVEIDLGGC